MSDRTGWRAGENDVLACGPQAVEDGQREGRGLAGAGLGGGEDVAACEDDGDGGCLDRRRGRVALLGDGLQQIGREAERIEGQACAPAWIPAVAGGGLPGARRRPNGGRPAACAVRPWAARSIADIDSDRRRGQPARPRPSSCSPGPARPTTIHEYALPERHGRARDARPDYGLEAAAALGCRPGPGRQDARRPARRRPARAARRPGRSAARPASRGHGTRRQAAELAEPRTPSGDRRRGRRDQPAGAAAAAGRSSSTTRSSTVRRSCVSAGRRGRQVELAPTDLVNLTKATVAPIARTGPVYAPDGGRGLPRAGILERGPQASRTRQTGNNRRTPPPRQDPVALVGCPHSTAAIPAHPGASRTSIVSDPRSPGVHGDRRPRAPHRPAAGGTKLRHRAPCAVFRERGGTSLAGPRTRRPEGVLQRGHVA